MIHLMLRLTIYLLRALFSWARRREQQEVDIYDPNVMLDRYLKKHFAEEREAERRREKYDAKLRREDHERSLKEHKK